MQLDTFLSNCRYLEMFWWPSARPPDSELTCVPRSDEDKCTVIAILLLSMFTRCGVHSRSEQPLFRAWRVNKGEIVLPLDWRLSFHPKPQDWASEIAVDRVAQAAATSILQRRLPTKATSASAMGDVQRQRESGTVARSQ